MKPNQSANRIDIVSIKLVKEGMVCYKGRTIHRPDDGYTLMKEFLHGLDGEHFLVIVGVGLGKTFPWSRSCLRCDYQHKDVKHLDQCEWLYPNCELRNQREVEAELILESPTGSMI
ncbi:hypothetical protein KD909_03275 [Exiguobacterium sp. PFWT01]|uniref:hypothetical protein n=1 Tax=Exiguobacterium sp. PFWT01 TaxID=2829816 RepID=UPI001BAC7986|nr:hypothetical protein [Exiguobacterium sp. PFWT01]QUP87769.1 hypothetical protein KD909_03275 [Exiguobacterium sp. PFWT01]